MVVEGLSAGPARLYASTLNQALARALDADVLLAAGWPPDGAVEGLVEQLAIAASGYISGEEARVTGAWSTACPRPIRSRPRACGPL